MALWQMKTLIRDGRVSILFFFNPYPGAFAGPPCLCLCAKKFPASLCNKILFGERSNKLTMWAHHSRGGPCHQPNPKQRACSGPGRLGHLDWPVVWSRWPRWSPCCPPALWDTQIYASTASEVSWVPKENRSVNKMQSGKGELQLLGAKAKVELETGGGTLFSLQPSIYSLSVWSR